MRRNGVRSGLGLAALVGGLLIQASGCGDDAGDDPALADGGPQPSTAADAQVVVTAEAGAGSSGIDARAPSAEASVAATSDAASSTSSDASRPSSAPSDAGAPASDAASVPSADAGLLALPKVLSLSGCADLGVPALCSVAQSGSAFVANCGGAKFAGTVASDRTVTLTAPSSMTREGAKVDLTCSGKLQGADLLVADCKQTTAAVGTTPAAEKSCKLRSDSQILPGVSCMELPAQLDQVAICKEGAAQGGTTIAAGSCKVVQDGCAFQAECGNDLTLSGTVSQTGLRFTRTLKALADAATPANGMPAFVKGAEVNHTCTGTLSAGKLTGSCTAGNIRGVMPTSVCGLEASGAMPATCAPIGPTRELLFALDSCDALESGEGSMPGIGEPVCAFRQNGCIWDLQCGSDPLTHFGGRLAPSDTKLSWRLATGTPCELDIDESGAVRGSCTVPGQTTCSLASKPAVPGAMNCPVLPGGSNVKSHGCGGGDPLSCRATLQHGCGYMALCGFTANNPDLLIAGTTSLRGGRPRFEFNGLGEYDCAVDKATDAEIASGDRAPWEWYGQCSTPSGGMCRDNYDPATKMGFRGLRLYFDLPAGTPIPPTAPAAPPAATPAAPVPTPPTP